MNALSKIVVKSVAALLLTSTLLISAAALAQVPDRVGRIAYLAGDVQFYSEGAQAWLPAQLNAPVSSRNSLFTGAGSRAEIRFGSTAVALDGLTQLDVQVLDDNSFKAVVPRGSVSLRVRQIEGDESYEITAPLAAYVIRAAGRYRIDAANNGSSVSVLAGLVNVLAAGNDSAMVEAGQELSVSGGGFVRSPASGSALDSWAAQRDNAYGSSQSARYVSPNMTGYEELDANGRWASDPDYGNVWYPTTHVSAGWVPYRDGHWAFVPPWGWTWIDDAPWGFAPFHYGRWVLIGSRWAWMPGTYVRRPSYAPALVGFIGGGTAVSISVGNRPAVGWYPLAPWEHYRPTYGHHERQLRSINNFNIARPPSRAWQMVDHKRISTNQMQGATLVPHDAFVDSRPVHRAAIPVTSQVLLAPHVGSAPVVAPGRAGVNVSPGNERREAGDRRFPGEPDRERAARTHGNSDPRNGGGAALPPADASPSSASGGAASGPRIYRTERRGAEREPQQPASVAPPAGQPASVPRIDHSQPRQWGGAEQGTGFPPRREGGPRGSVPATVNEPVPQPRSPQPEAVAPRSEAPVRTEPRGEPRVMQRIEPRAEPRIEQRSEPRPEPRPEQRPMQRVEPQPQIRVPAPQQQPEQRRAPEQGRERRPYGERPGGEG